MELSCLLLWACLTFVVGFNTHTRRHQCCRRRLTTTTAVSSPETITIHPIRRLQGSVVLPGSKSMTNRALLLASLCSRPTRLSNVLRSDDSAVLIDALRSLEIGIVEEYRLSTLLVIGNSTCLHGRSASLYLGNAGTAMRSLTAILAASRKGSYALDGDPRMRERPIGDLVQALQQLGCKVECSASNCPPVHIIGNQVGLAGGTARLSGQISSQFLSALLMAAPMAQKPVRIEIVDGPQISAPYVHMTMQMMHAFGVQVENVGGADRVFEVQPSTYTSPGTYNIEGDASSASYFLAAGAIVGGPVTVQGCGRSSLQGDVRFAEILSRMGANVEMTNSSITVSRDVYRPLIGVEEDCGDIPDAAMTLAIVGLFAQGRTVIRNVYNWRLKETERMAAMVTELRKVSAHVQEGRDYLIVEGLQSGGQHLKDGVEIDTYTDHRMAMCFSLVACGGVTVHIRNPACVHKTFPHYFEALAQLVK